MLRSPDTRAKVTMTLLSLILVHGCHETVNNATMPQSRLCSPSDHHRTSSGCTCAVSASQVFSWMVSISQPSFLACWLSRSCASEPRCGRSSGRIHGSSWLPSQLDWWGKLPAHLHSSIHTTGVRQEVRPVDEDVVTSGRESGHLVGMGAAFLARTNAPCPEDVRIVHSFELGTLSFTMTRLPMYTGRVGLHRHPGVSMSCLHEAGPLPCRSA